MQVGDELRLDGVARDLEIVGRMSPGRAVPTEAEARLGRQEGALLDRVHDALPSAPAASGSCFTRCAPGRLFADPNIDCTRLGSNVLCSWACSRCGGG